MTGEPDITSIRWTACLLVSSTGEDEDACLLDALRARGADPRVARRASGGESRPFSSVADAMEAGEGLAVASVSRLGGGVADATLALARLRARGVHLLVPGEGVDTLCDPGGALDATVAAMGAWRRRRAGARVRAGLEAARGRGRVGGRPPSMTADRMVQARRLLAEGLSPGEVARSLGMSRSTVYRHMDELDSEDTMS